MYLCTCSDGYGVKGCHVGTAAECLWLGLLRGLQHARAPAVPRGLRHDQVCLAVLGARGREGGGYGKYLLEDLGIWVGGGGDLGLWGYGGGGGDLGLWGGGIWGYGGGLGVTCVIFINYHGNPNFFFW